MADLLDVVHRDRCGRRRREHADRTERQNPAHGKHAYVLSKIALRRRAVPGLYLFRDRSADRERADKSDRRSAFAEEKETRRDPRRDLRRDLDALDLHPVLYVPVELHVHDLLCVRPVPGHHGIRGMETAEAGGRNAVRRSVLSLKTAGIHKNTCCFCAFVL